MTGEITILYGSETGNAEEYAKYLETKIKILQFETNQPCITRRLSFEAISNTHFVFNYNMFYNRTRRNP